MNLDAIWQTHRRFLIGVAIGFVVFLIAKGFINSMARGGERIAQGKIRVARGKLGTPAYDAGAVSRLRNHKQELDARIDRLAETALPAWRSEFQPKAGRSPSGHYIELTGRMRDELLSWALRNNVDVDETLGLPPVSPTDPQKIQRVLRGLDVVERLVRLAVAHRARTVDDIEISMRAKSVRKPGMPVSPLDITPVHMTVLFEEGLAYGFVRELLSAENDPFGLVGVEVMPLDPRKNQRRVVLEFGAGAVPIPEEVE